MCWRIRHDFISLFNCGKNDISNFPAINGLRAIANILIILCHLITIFGALVPSYPHIEWQQYLTSMAFGCSPLTVFALEIFFMLSGFLLTHKLIRQWNKNPKDHDLFLKQYPISILKRAFRFWPGFITFNPTTMPLNLVLRRYNYLSLILPPYISQWMENHYNLTLSYELLQTSPLKMFLDKMYFPLEARFGSFIIGAMLAIKVIDSSHYVGKSSMMKYLFSSLTFLYMSLFVTSSDMAKDIPDYVFKLAMATGRQMFAIGQAFLLFTALCSPSHPYHLRWINKFLSLRIWIPISKLSYLVYVTHWRLSFELIFGGPLLFLRTYSITYTTLISVPIVLFISQIISCIWYVFVEKPVQRAINFYFDVKKSIKTQAKKNI